MRRKEWKRLLTASMAALVLTSAVPIHANESIEQQAEEQQEGTETEEQSEEEKDLSEQMDSEELSKNVDKSEIEEESESQSKTEQETETKSQTEAEQETEEESELQSKTEQETKEESELQSKTEQETEEEQELQSETEQETETEADDMLVMFANEILEEDDVIYEDGTYEGTSTGYHNGKITVRVTIKDHKIEKVDVIEKDKQSWWDKKDVDSWIDHFLGLMTKKEVSEVDTIASATKSTTGVKNAILDALSKAPVVEEKEQIFDSGDGSEENPYVIETEDNLYAFAKSCEEGEVYEGQYIVLSEDITLTEDWNPIQEFAGSFDGDGHSISHVRIGNEEEPLLTDCAGFFARLSHCAEIRDVHFEDVKIFAQSDDTARGYVGGIAGYSGISRDDQITIDGCSVEGTLISSKSNVYAYAGGITAYASMGEVSITNSYTDIEVKAENERGMAMAGGIAATTGNKSFTMNCASLGKIYTKGTNINSRISNYAGGLMAMPSGLVYNCYSASDVEVQNTTPAEDPSIGSAFGMIPANAVISNVYYGEHAGITIDGDSSDSRFSGKSMGKVRNAVSVSEIDTEAFATKMEKALSTAEKSSMDIYMQDLGYDEKEFLNTYCNKVIWQGWKLENGKVILSGEAYVEKEQISIFEQGDGTKENPYVIADKDQFMKFADSFSESTDYAGEYIELGQSIDVSETEWNPLGQKENGYVPFKGHFDGKGHEIRGIRIGDKEQLKEDSYHMYYGLFTELGENAVVCNLAVTDVAIYVEGDASIMAGAIAGSIRNATVDNCKTDGIIVVKTTNSSDELTGANSFGGGIAGYAMYSNIVNCQTDVDIDVFCRTANAEAGGIAGLAAFGVVANCVTFGDVAGETDRTVDDGGVTYLSGIIGCNAQQVANCYQTGDIISRSWTIRAGGISGMATGISETSYNYYNADATQMINGEKINPVEGIGQIVGSGVGEDGAYDGAIVKENVAKNAGYLGSQDMADLLNSNFEHFPIDLSVLPEGITLKKWIIKDGVVTVGTEAASVTYIKLEQPKPPVTYMDGTYYGRSAFGTSGEIIVAVLVENGIIIEITLDKAPEEFEQSVMGDMIQTVLEQQELDAEDTVLESDVRTESVIAFKNAIQVALGKALIGDLTGYGRVNPQEVFAGGEGTKENPYQIATADQLMKFAMSVNEDENYNGQYVVLTKDIDLKGYAWMPAGSAGAHPFSGNFDGQSHIINNMKIGTEEKAAHYFASGLFSYASGAVISNVGINDAYVHVARSDSNRAYAGIVVGAIDDDNDEQKGTVINNCSVKGTIINSAQSWSESGGITGYVWQGLIMNCMADVVIEGTSSSNYVEAGGIAGLGGYSALYNNYAKGSIHATAGVNSASIGGIVGMNGGTAVNNTADVELISTRSSIDIGGITGRNTGIALINGGYFSSDTLQKSGDTTLENEAVGTNVTMTSTGIIKNAEGKTSQELKSEEFIKLLNDNISSEDMYNDFMLAITDYPLTIGDTVPDADKWQMSNNSICLEKAVLYQEDKKTQEENTDDKKQENTGTSFEQTNTKESDSSKKKHSSSKNKNTASNTPDPAIINDSAPVNVDVDTVVNPAEVNVDTTGTPVETDNITTIASQEIPKEVTPASIQNEAAALRENNQAYGEETQNETESVKEAKSEETDDKKEEELKEDESKGQQIKIEEQETPLANHEGTNNRVIWFIIAVLLVGAAAGSYITMNKKHMEK